MKTGLEQIKLTEIGGRTMSDVLAGSLISAIVVIAGIFLKFF